VDPALPTEKGTAAPTCRHMFVVAKWSPISATAEMGDHSTLSRNVAFNENTQRKYDTEHEGMLKSL